VLCLVTQFSIEFFGMSRFGCLPGQSFEIISRFDRKMGDRGESDQILFCLESPEIKNVLFVCLKSFVCQVSSGNSLPPVLSGRGSCNRKLYNLTELPSLATFKGAMSLGSWTLGFPPQDWTSGDIGFPEILGPIMQA
jgi:hypothetical protein